MLCRFRRVEMPAWVLTNKVKYPTKGYCIHILMSVYALSCCCSASHVFPFLKMIQQKVGNSFPQVVGNPRVYVCICTFTSSHDVSQSQRTQIVQRTLHQYKNRHLKIGSVHFLGTVCKMIFVLVAGAILERC